MHWMCTKMQGTDSAPDHNGWKRHDERASRAHYEINLYAVWATNLPLLLGPACIEA